jgi:DNA polymerase III delta prime subunit
MSSLNRHAVCYVGESLDKFAEHEARKILCESGQACGTCRSCIKVQNKSHPDLIYLREYKIKEVREAVAAAAVRPNDGEFKVYIFPNADSMRPECQNALLKFTEEPPDYVKIIFTAKSPDLLLDTIKSRLFFVNAGNDAHTAPPDELNSIAKEFVAALVRRSEHGAAAALTRIKTRDDLSKILDLISVELNVGRAALGAPYAEIQKFLLDITDDLIYNPNISLFCAHITAEVFRKTEKLRGKNG